MIAAHPLNSSSSSLHIEAITEFQAFLGLHDIWDRLINEAGIDHPFLSHDWIRTWWECFGKGKQLHIILIRNRGVPVALIPLMYSTGRMYGLKMRQLEFIYNSHTPRCDFIVTGSPIDVYRAVWNYLIEIGASWDLIKLPQLTLESQTLRVMRDMARDDNSLVGCWPSTESPYLPLAGTWDDYCEGLGRKHRSNIRNRLSRLRKMGAVGLEIFSTQDEIAHSLQAGLEIEAKAWKGQAGTAILCHSDLLAFYQNFAQRAAKQGWMRLYFLTLNGRKIAFSYSLRYRKTLYMLKPGYDPALASLSPSNLLCSMMIQDAFKIGLGEYDFLGTNDEWKLNWTGVTRPHCWLFIFSKTLPAILLHYLKFHVSPELKKFRLFRMLSNAGGRMFNADHS